MAVFSVNGTLLNRIFNKNGEPIPSAYDKNGDVVFGVLPIPTGNLTASQSVPLPDLYETGKGFTCTGLAYDALTDTFLVGDIGTLLPNGAIRSQIVRLSSDFTQVIETIPLNAITSNDVQGVTIDTSDNTIWFCVPSDNKIYHISKAGAAMGSITIQRPSGISYASADDTFWVLDYNNNIVHINKNGTVLGSFASTFGEALDQCFLDEGHGYLYITAGVNYTGRNNVYRFDTESHTQAVACTVDSYSVEGIWIGIDRMIIINDGYYHSAAVPTNLANIYLLN